MILTTSECSSTSNDSLTYVKELQKVLLRSVAARIHRDPLSTESGHQKIIFVTMQQQALTDKNSLSIHFLWL